MNTTLFQCKPPKLTGSCVESKRDEIKAFFVNTWQTYESLFAQINNDEAYYEKPEPLRHPLIFYYGHTATFFINKLILGKYIDTRINRRLESICAVGVDEMSWDDLNTDNYDWPSVNEVQAYRDSVYQKVINVITTMPLSLPIKQDSLAWIILMGCEHERIHLETSSVIMRMLSLEHLTPNEHWSACAEFGEAPENRLIEIPEKTVTLGKSDIDLTYGWDNEYGTLTVDVQNFKASQYLVSNHEFLSFVKAGGYQKPSYWDEEGRNWLSYKKPNFPVFWHEKNGEYFQRNLNQIIPLPLSWPAEVNYLEAKAFCNWKSEQTGTYIRMPTEAEWYLLRDYVPDDLLAWDRAPGNVNLERYASSCPVNAIQSAATHAGEPIFDIVGNVWQWTESAIDGFNGFKVHPLYDDFSTPTFDGKHNLIKGGSWISTGNEAIKSSRYAFRRHFFQHAGFRYIESKHKDVPVTQMNSFETDVKVSQQLECHYGVSKSGIHNYPKAIANIVIQAANANSLTLDKCLDLGCSVGRTSFELARYFSHIDGVDFSARFIQHGVQLQNNKPVRYALPNQGDIAHYKEYTLDESLLNTKHHIEFSQGDATNLKAKFSHYDAILAQHILEQSYDPSLFLQNIHERLNQHGLLIITSDYQFDEKVTDKSKWIGGIKVNGENVTGFDGLVERLSPHFTFIDESNVTREIKISDRQSLVSNTHVTIWKKK